MNHRFTRKVVLMVVDGEGWWHSEFKILRFDCDWTWTGPGPELDNKMFFSSIMEFDIFHKIYIQLDC